MLKQWYCSLGLHPLAIGKPVEMCDLDAQPFGKLAGRVEFSSAKISKPLGRRKARRRQDSFNAARVFARPQARNFEPLGHQKE